jgi:glucose-1-phosphate adenylyltransferase
MRGAMNDCLAVILGGGRGTRLFPLTHQRSKPAVPIGGKYRLIDIPISNCLNSNLRRIFVLTQYNSESLNKHLSMTYKFDVFSSAFVTVLAAEQTEDSPEWFQGTADAVRQSMRHLESHRSREVLILSGDQLYQMDFQRMLDTHRRNVADATVAVLPVSAEQTSGFGILKVNRQGRIVQFEEKPGPERLPDLESEIPGYGRGFLASMGIYMFSREALGRVTSDASLVDFGRHVIPKAIGELRVQAHFHRGYWEDVGTIRSYYEANLLLCDAMPPFDFYDAARPVYTNPRFLPATKIAGCTLSSALVSEGGILMGATIERSVVGIRSRIGQGTQVRHSLVLGADYYESLEEIDRARANGRPPVGIGEDSVIERAIVDKNARVGRGVRIVNGAAAQELDGEGYFIRDGIVIVPKGGVIPDGTVI